MKRTAVILANLGTPDSPTPESVAKFLKSFLSDSRVVEAPRLIWWFVLRMVIIPLRKKKVAHSYQQIWWEEGSPLRIITERQVVALQEELQKKFVDRFPLVASAMTYGEPSLATTVKCLQEKGVDQFLIVPMYPQYSASTTGAIYDQLADIVRRSRDVPDFSVVKSFQNYPGYIENLANSIRASWEKNERHEKLLMSFHGVPQEYVDKGDPYYCHCRETAELVAANLGLAESDWAMSFQSRFGPKQWLQPYTDELLIKWASEGVRSVDVISPAFVTDCLETLEELDVTYRQIFTDAGGSHYQYISCLNDSSDFIQTLAEIISDRLLPRS